MGGSVDGWVPTALAQLTILSSDSSTAAAAASADAVGESRETGVAEEGDLSAANSRLSGGGRIFSRRAPSMRAKYLNANVATWSALLVTT